MKTVIIGGVAGGASAAARLRRLDENAEITIIEKGNFISFANCGLPYFIGGDITEQSSLTLQTPQSFKARFNIEVKVNHEAMSVNSSDKAVIVKNLFTGEVYEEKYDNLIISPGAKPIIPPIIGSDSDKVFTLRNIPDTLKIKKYAEERKPASALILGGGYIGIEMAENLSKLGIKVTIAELSDHVINSLDYDMASDIHKYLIEKGIELIFQNGVKEITDKGNNLQIELDKGSLCTDMLIISAGVRPETEFLSDSGIEMNGMGSILTNEHMQTNIKNIYAAGDAAAVKNFITDQEAFIPLAGPANKQGRIAADNICGINSSYKGTQGSSVIKIFDMTAASTGINEKTALEYGIKYDKTYTYSPSHAAYYPGAKNMSVKLLWEKGSHKILGAQIVGYDGVDKRCDVIASAIRFGAKATDLAELELCYAPPYGSAKDPVNMAGFAAENIITGKLKQFFWSDVEKLPHDGSVTLLDVRTETERNNGKIEGFIHIPLDSLRGHTDQIPIDKPVYIHCHSGLRSYIACRILTGLGYDCYNLAGGYRLYESAANKKSIPEYNCKKCR